MTGIVTRRLAPPDAPLYRSLMLEAYALCPDAFTSSVAEREMLPLQWWSTRVASEPGATELVVGAFSGDELVGAAGLSFEQRERTCHKAHLFGMYVRSAFRGKGIGRLLVGQVVDLARASGRVELIQLTVSEPNRLASALYASCGFEPFGTEPMALKRGDKYISKVHMWRPVP
jgi:ribosomal protein S18 acetylase RimI-like enzyme